MQIEVMESSNKPDCDDELIQRKSVSFNKKVSIIRVQSFKEKNKENIPNLFDYKYKKIFGYTPLEAIAFHVPCITTSLSGFGLWANKVKGDTSHLSDGVEVIDRDDYNYNDVARAISHAILTYASLPSTEADAIRKKAARLSQKALWKHFITYYQQAYDIALRNAAARLQAIPEKNQSDKI